MKLAYTYFCYKEDQEMLKLSLDNIDWLRQKDDIDVYIIDDSQHPMTDIPKGVNYHQSTFPRNGNLRGYYCVLGMLQEYESIMAKKDYDWVVKIDADVIVNTWKWLRNADPKKYAQAGTLHPKWVARESDFGVCHGCVHCFSALGLKILREKLEENLAADMLSVSELYPEDRLSSRLISMDGLAKNWFVKNNTNNPFIDTRDRGVYFDFIEKATYPRSFPKMLLRQLSQYSAITFKDVTRNGVDPVISREAALKRMQRYIDQKLNRNPKCDDVEYSSESFLQYQVAMAAREPISVKDLLEHSFVLSINDAQFDFMKAAFDVEGLAPFPKKFEGFQTKKICAWRNEGGQKGHIDVNPIMFPVINCQYSHAAMIKLAQALDWPYICIFEDDAYPQKGICKKLEAYLKDIPADIDFLILGWNVHELTKDNVYAGKYQKFNYSWGSHAYIVFKSGYQKYFDTMNSSNAVADVIFSTLPNTYTTLANLFVQYNNIESIVSRSTGFHSKKTSYLNPADYVDVSKVQQKLADNHMTEHNTSDIPHVIYYAWFGHKELPEIGKRCIESWKRHMPDYKIIQIDESNYDINKNAYVKKLYELKQYAFVTDYVRHDVLQQNGGVFMDIDEEILAPFDDLVQQGPFLSYTECRKQVECGTIMCLDKGNDIGKAVIDYVGHATSEYLKNIDKQRPFFDSEFVTNWLTERGFKLNGTQQLVNGLQILPTEFFMSQDRKTERSRGQHLFLESWKDPLLGLQKFAK